MLKITIPSIELYDEEREEFITSKEQTLCLEHSLVSLSKWESKWNVPFLSKKTKMTTEMYLDYIRCMTITQNVDPKVYQFITNKNREDIEKYMESPMTATAISVGKQSSNKEIMTAEILYYKMIDLNIPFECQKWHLNRLLTLINVCSIKKSPPKKMSQKDTLRQYAALNKARRKRLGTKG